jgi:ABC-type branched-subunit amino acid transport system ATPase component
VKKPLPVNRCAGFTGVAKMPEEWARQRPFRSIIGFTPPRSGIIRFQDREIQGFPPYEICWMGLALVPQGRHIFSSLRVEEILLVGA